MADEDVQEQAEQDTGEKKKGLLENKMVVLALIVLLQGGMGFAAVQFVIKPHLAPSAEEMAEGDEVDGGDERVRGQLVSMEEMVVSLSTPGRPRYLRTSIALEAADGKTVKAIEDRMPEFRDVAILKLSSFSPAEVSSFEGKEAVKAEIKNALKGVLGDGELLNVYFTDFVIQ